MDHQKHVILTGSPGIGKTTLVGKICGVLKAKGVNCAGFVTEEVREKGERIGFDVVTVDGRRGPLSRKSSLSRFKVGQYGVEVEEFEKLALPEFSKVVDGGVLIIDEVGKMEMFSKKFQKAVRDAFSLANVRIVVTIPIKRGQELIEIIRCRQDGKLYTLSVSNREKVLPEILQTLNIQCS